MRLLALLIPLAAATSPALSQEVVVPRSPAPQGQDGTAAPPSVDVGIANGIAKRSGSPSVGDGMANGVVKKAGAPSIGDGVANGVVKSTTIHQ